MKKLLMLMIVTAMITTAALAQIDQKKVYKKERTEWEYKIKTELNLTTDQVGKFDALNKEYSDKMDAIALDANMDKETLKEKKMALKKEKEVKLNDAYF